MFHRKICEKLRLLLLLLENERFQLRFDSGIYYKLCSNF